MKICRSCNLSKTLDDFGNDRRGKDGKKSTCKTCINAKNKEAYKKNKEPFLTRKKRWKENNRTSYSESGRRYYIKNKNKIAEYTRLNRDKINKRWKEWRQENLEACRQREREYREVNRDSLREKRRATQKRRNESDICYRLRKIVAVSVRQYMKKNGSIKNGSILSALPYTMQQLRDHLESQFNAEMNWDNYGTYWEIDHIYPQSKLLFDSYEHPNFLKCWSLDNLQPLTKSENIKKGDKL